MSTSRSKLLTTVKVKDNKALDEIELCRRPARRARELAAMGNQTFVDTVLRLQSFETAPVSRENDASIALIASPNRARWRPPLGCCSADRSPSPALTSKSPPLLEYRDDRVSDRDDSAAGVLTMRPKTETHISVSRRFRKRRRRRKVSCKLSLRRPPHYYDLPFKYFLPSLLSFHVVD